jgi:hypothetical protein
MLSYRSQSPTLTSELNVAARTTQSVLSHVGPQIEYRVWTALGCVTSLLACLTDFPSNSAFFLLVPHNRGSITSFSITTFMKFPYTPSF